MIPVEVKGIEGGISAARDALRPFPFVSLHPDHFMHISLVIVGFVTDEPGGPNEFSKENLAELAELAKEVVAGFGEFRLKLANLGAFPSAAFIEAYDEAGEIDKLRRSLFVCCGLEGKPGPPHLTLAYFTVKEKTNAPPALIEAIEPLRNRTFGSFTVRHVDLTLLDLTEEYAKPEIFARLPLS